MNYDEFRNAWHQALSAAGIRLFPFPPTETVDVGHVSRTYEVCVGLGGVSPFEPFGVVAKLSWTWDALQCARTNTTEEDLLAELLGLERLDEDTEQPWLRVDVSLRATLPWDSPLSLPRTSAWRRWVAEVIDRLAPLLPTEYALKDQERLVLSWRGEPEARVVCAPNGQLLLTGVEISAWLGIDLPRQWDDPEREPDEPPDEQLANLAQRIYIALGEWQQCLRHLGPATAAKVAE